MRTYAKETFFSDKVIARGSELEATQDNQAQGGAK